VWFDLLAGTLDHLRAGGSVMIPLLVISLWMWLLILVKWLELHNDWKREISLPRCLAEWSEGGLRAALWQEEILTGYMAGRSRRDDLDRRLIQSLVKRQETRIYRYIQTILVLAAVAPLMGLVGTVTGMIFTFDVIAEFGTGNARALASGISKALITTQTGLLVAVPGLFLGNFLRRRAEKTGGRIRRFGLGLMRETSARP